MKLLVKKDFESMSYALAQIIVPYLTSDEKKVLSLTAGTTPLRSYEIIKEMLKASDSQVSSKAHFFQQDNIYLSTEPEDHKRFDYINDTFFEANGIPDSQITYLTDETYQTIDELIEEAGGLEFAIMGIGADGHVAANMPGTPFENKGYRVTLEPEIGKMMTEQGGFKKDVDTYVSIGMKTLMKTKKIIVVANGEGKADILNKAFNEPITTEIQASILQFHPDVTILCDEAASVKLL